ncbi:hypothetical protein CYLTODRAFT_368987 [Cylindrobasidium torrendii FP15055 ss-10]|uniref:Uncharacterized protein n=1 Tax=Cylindrobasidium torrendii FP15055 ss-10 TaxID=1314674 RepID=A0A0D7BMC4_9AGAR|nr:hypothetical protein CYLTODRAFT_368987 [Cylindrobasidium torrendii FP15055 ss-10]
MSPNTANNFASFAAYAPPPDESARISRTYPAQGETSYQSGGVPTFGTAQAGSGAISSDAAESQHDAYLTRLPVRLDVLAAFAYVLGPVSAFIVLLLETTNDYVRFNAYQSALLTGPLLVVRILMSLIGFWQWLRTLYTWVIVFLQLFMAFKAFTGAAGSSLSRYYLPYLGQLAEDWVADE